MKITFVLPFAGHSGGHRVVAIHAREMMARGHEVTIVSTPLPPSRTSWKKKLKYKMGFEPHPPERPLAPWFADFGIPHHQLETFRVPNADDIPDADVIIATWWETAEWVAALPPEKGSKYYFLQDYEVFPYLPRDRVIATFHLDLHKIAVSDYIRDTIAQTHQTDAPIDVVKNAIDHTEFKTPERVRGTPFTIGFIYSPVVRKNVGRALDAVQQALTNDPSLNALAFGTTPELPELPLPKGVTYYQNPEQGMIPKLYAQADVWLFTSDSEGFGLPILEAMACRTPVLATDAGAAPQILTAQNGRLLPKDPAAFAQAIAEIAAMPAEDWRTMSDAARATAEGYTWEDATDRLLDILHRSN